MSTSPLAPADLLPTYRVAAAERETLGIPPLPLTAPQTQALCELLQAPPAGEEGFLLHLLSERIPRGWMRRPT
jgi:aconitate hydratase 2/2-methylisocitrate dehydratase